MAESCLSVKQNYIKHINGPLIKCQPEQVAGRPLVPQKSPIYMSSVHLIILLY